MQAEADRPAGTSGRPADALEPNFICKLCQDTGSVNGRTCSCVHKVMQQLRRKEIEELSSLSISSFDTMELRYYPEPCRERWCRPRLYGRLLADLRSYAEEFDHHSESLMLFGNAGLGKTHAALAIAGIVLEKGYDVIYVSSPDFFSKLEGLHFGSDPAGEEETLMQTAAGADLLILDDLGTEFNSAFLISTLYSLLNNRLGASCPPSSPPTSPTVLCWKSSIPKKFPAAFLRYSLRFLQAMTSAPRKRLNKANGQCLRGGFAVCFSFKLPGPGSPHCGAVPARCSLCPAPRPLRPAY